MFVHAENQDSHEKNDTYITAIQLISAINYEAFDEKKEIVLTELAETADTQDEEETEANRVILLTPESLDGVKGIGYEAIRGNKAVITYGIDF